MNGEELQKCINVVESLLTELRTIKKRKYFRDYYRRRKKGTTTRLRKRPIEQEQQDIETRGYVYFD